ncbi:MAG: heme-dependent oxidative N-demethylase subunit alpha family protein [Burkholderiaceae bacterium]
MTNLSLLAAPILGPESTRWPTHASAPGPVIEVPHRIRPDLLKLGDAPILLEDSEWSEWVEDKRARLERNVLVSIQPDLEPSAVAQLAASVRQYFQRVLPDGPIDTNGRFPWLGGFEAPDEITFFNALSLSLQEDFAVMLNTSEQGLKSVILSVSFPSGWVPGERLGQSMTELHQPVADNGSLQKAMPAVSQAMTEKGPFMRTVWTLAGSAARARPPGTDDTALLTRADQLWFRHERQLTLPLGGGACLFLIRVMLAPYRSVIREAQDYARLMAALNSMSDAVVAYKNLAHASALVRDSGADFKAAQ